MNEWKIRQLPAFVLMACMLTPLWAAEFNGERQRVPTVTRLVQLFSGLESDLMVAVQKGDAPTIDKLLAEDFELRSGAMPGIPTPRAEWLQQSKNQFTAPIVQMSVHDYGTAAVVSYLWQRGVRRDVFIVDVWVRIGDAWKLSVRYASPGGDRKFKIPGAGAGGANVEKK